MDTIIIQTVKIIGWLAVLAVGLGLVLLISNYAWRIWRQTLAWPLWAAAISEYRKAHPEKFKHFDADRSDSA